jgi:anti-sigma factor RsiW
MHCSSCEPFLDAYVDGTLSPARAAKVATHVDACSRCASLLAELRVIDGLLLAPRQIDLAANFTFKVMAETRSMPAPRAHHTDHLAHHLSVLGAYVVFAWLAIAGFLLFGGRAARAMIAMIGDYGTHLSHAFAHLEVITGHVFGRQSFDVTAAMGGVIALDLTCAAIVVALYSLVRNRRFQGSSD